MDYRSLIFFIGICLAFITSCNDNDALSQEELDARFNQFNELQRAQVSTFVPPQAGRVPGVLRISGLADTVGVRFVVPQKLVAGRPITLELTTYGDFCFSEGEVEVRSVADTLEFRPFDFFKTPSNFICPDVIGLIFHDIKIVPPASDSMFIRLIGDEIIVKTPPFTARDTHSVLIPLAIAPQ